MHLLSLTGDPRKEIIDYETEIMKYEIVTWGRLKPLKAF